MNKFIGKAGQVLELAEESGNRPAYIVEDRYIKTEFETIKPLINQKSNFEHKHPRREIMEESVEESVRRVAAYLKAKRR